jgi:hypothetical protein
MTCALLSSFVSKYHGEDTGLYPLGFSARGCGIALVMAAAPVWINNTPAN